MLDEMKENIHFKGVINILTRLNIELPNDWNEIADVRSLKIFGTFNYFKNLYFYFFQKFDLASNLKKINYTVCDNIKLFGICEENSCLYRHRIIADIDFPKTIITM
jgi:hypothetical protein